MTHPIPAEALDKHIAILGKTGSGKSNLAKTIAEDLLARGARVCVIDPTGTWWGLRLATDGATPSGYPIVIFGEENADLPAGAGHGEHIAHAIGTSSTPAIIDTCHLTVKARTRLFTDFAETLIRANRGELTLIIDEAHLFMPQSGAQRGGDQPAMLHAGNNLVSLGRGRGLRIVLITQRPAKLHKDSLTQVETLVAMRLIAPQDRRAIDDWMGEWADAHEGEELMKSLPKLPTGDAWVWSPEIDHLARAHCPLAATYDTGSVRAGDNPVLPSLDVAEIASRIEEVGSELLAEDPKRLKRRVAELEREIREKRPAVTIDEAEIERRVQAALVPFHESFTRHLSESGSALTALSRDLRALAGRLDEARGALVTEGPPPPARARRGTAPEGASQAPISPSSAPNAPSRHPSTPSSRPSTSSNPSEPGTDPTVTGPQQRVLDALAWLYHLGFGERASRTQVAFLAKYKPKGGSFNNTLGSLRSAGLIEYPAPGAVELTKTGLARARAPTGPLTDEDMHRAVMDCLTGPQRRVLQPLIDRYPLDMGVDELAREAGYEAGGGAFNNTRGSLRSLGLIEYPGPGRAVALPVLFVEGAA